MIWIVIIAVIVIVVFLVKALNDGTTNHNTESTYIPFDEEISIATDDNEYENYEEYEVTGVHIANRKNYILNFCTEFEEVDLYHEKNNTYSSEAIAVKHQGKKIGYISRDDSDEVHEILPLPHKCLLTSIDYDGDFLTVYMSIEY